MEREKFSGNLLNQNKGFGRIEPGLRYLSPFIFSCFNHQILVKHWSSLRCFFRVVQRHICAFWSCRKFYMCMDSSCRMICWKVCILYSICSLFEQGKVYFHYRVHLTVYRCMYHRIPRYHRIPVLFISHIKFEGNMLWTLFLWLHISFSLNWHIKTKNVYFLKNS
jgi:hypothetical protein